MEIKLDDSYRNILDLLKLYVEKTDETYIEEGFTDTSDQEIINYLIHLMANELKPLNIVFKCPKCEEMDSMGIEGVFDFSDDWSVLGGAYCETHVDTKMEIVGFERVKRYIKK